MSSNKAPIGARKEGQNIPLDMIKEFTIQLFSNLLYQTTPTKILAEFPPPLQRRGIYYRLKINLFISNRNYY